MVPRLHKRGKSFKGATLYALHDPGQSTKDRIGWTLTQNLGNLDVEDCWFAMYETWADRTRLKREAGVDPRGRDNTSPVLHYSLNWAPDERPSAEHMQETALSSLKALKLDAHQAVIAAHHDKDHWHVHIVVNTVNPDTGRTAPLKYTKETLSRWAEAYEREHGIQCEARLDNNRKRDEIRNEREAEKAKAEQLKAQGQTPPPPGNFIDVKDLSPIRPWHIERRKVFERMSRHRAEIDHRHMVERDATRARQRGEYQDLLADGKAAAQVATDHVRGRYKHLWRELYDQQRKENAHLRQIEGNIFERAVYVFQNSERLGNGPPLSWKRKVDLIVSPANLYKAVDQLHTRERRELSMIQKVDTKEMTDKAWANYERRYAALKDRHWQERQAEKAAQKTIRKESVSWRRATDELQQERAGEIPPRQAARGPIGEHDLDYTDRIRAEIAAHHERNRAPNPWPSRPTVQEPPSRPPPVQQAFERAADPSPPPQAGPAVTDGADEVARIRREMEDYRKRHPGMDRGREM